MFIKILKFVGVMAIIAGAWWALAAVQESERVVMTFGQICRNAGRGVLLAGAGVVMVFLAKWREWEAEQKKKRSGRR